MFSENARRIAVDLLILALSVGFAFFLARTDILLHALDRTRGLEMIGSFVTGMFFTSAFTVAPAAATLGELSRVNGIFWTVLLGAAGAVLGDLLIFRFVENRFAAHLAAYVKQWGGTSRLQALLLRRSTRWISWVLGCLVIASPLPDELGVALLGASHMRMRAFLPLVFFANALGILVVCLAARAL